MSTERIEKCEDLIAWQKARELTKNIYKVTKQDAFFRDFGLKDQIRRASVSIMSNTASRIKIPIVRGIGCRINRYNDFPAIRCFGKRNKSTCWRITCRRLQPKNEN